MLRRLRVLAAFLMVPLVIFSNPQAAAAADWSTVEFAVPSAPLIGDSAPGTIDTVDCAVNLLNLGGYSVDVGSNGYCFGLPDVTWGYTQDGEAGSAYRIDVYGIAADATSCDGSLSSSLAQHPKNGTVRVAGSITSGSIAVSGEDCSLTEVCITLGSGRKDCVSVDIPAPEPDEPPSGEGTCIYGTPRITKGAESVHLHASGTYSNTWRQNVDLIIDGELPPGRAWTLAAYYPNATTGVYTSGSGHLQLVNRLTATTTLVQLRMDKVLPKEEPKPFPWEVAVQLSAPVQDALGTPWNGTGSTAHQNAATMATTPGLPPGVAHPYGGWTDPEHCRFWIGPKVHNVEGTEGDEPSSQINGTPPVEEPDPEPIIDTDPVVEDPDTDVDWLGQIWALLRAIWQALVAGFNAVVNALSGLAGAIVDGITSFFEGAFVPDDAQMEDRFNAVHGQWEDTSPAKYAGVLRNFNVGAASGCAGLPLDVTLPGDVRIQQNIGAACSGPMATTAGIVNVVLMACFMVGGAMACVRALGSGLGWNPAVGREGGTV